MILARFWEALDLPKIEKNRENSIFLRGSFEGGFWEGPGRFWDGFGRILEGFWTELGQILERFVNDFFWFLDFGGNKH